MRWSMGVVLVLFTQVPAVIGDDAAKEVERIQGEWQAVEVEAKGEKVPAEQVKQFRLVIKGDEITFGDRKSKFKLDPSKSPKAIDLTPLDGPAKGKTVPGIYSLEKGQLRICISNGPNDATRPQEFKTKGTELSLLTLELVKSK